jgi:hypothetical protein
VWDHERGFNKKRFNLLSKRQLFEPKKMGKANENGLRLVEMHLFTPKK